jgi:hypothetical protein
MYLPAETAATGFTLCSMTVMLSSDRELEEKHRNKRQGIANIRDLTAYLILFSPYVKLLLISPIRMIG